MMARPADQETSARLMKATMRACGLRQGGQEEEQQDEAGQAVCQECCDGRHVRALVDEFAAMGLFPIVCRDHMRGGQYYIPVFVVE